MRETLVHGRWPLLLPDHRAIRPEWPWWEAARICAMHHHLNPGDVVYDIGAEEGDMPALWATWGCEVLLVEPNPKAWPNIRATFEANHLDRLGCWDGYTIDHDRDHPTSLGSSRDWPTSAYGPLIGDHGFVSILETDTLPATTIDRIAELAPAPPDVITMDIEGAELSALHGATVTLAEHRPKVFVSVHPDFLQQYGHTADGVYGFMADLGYTRTYLGTDHEVHDMFLPA